MSTFSHRAFETGVECISGKERDQVGLTSELRMRAVVIGYCLEA